MTPYTPTDLEARKDALARECFAENRNRLMGIVRVTQSITKNIDLEKAPK